METDIKYFKQKVDAGADFAVTQMFFNNEHYFNFVSRCREAGINIRIIPGIMPITSYSQIERFIGLSGADIPEGVRRVFEANKENPEKMYQEGINIALKQCRELLEGGAPGLHFYTLNKSTATLDIYKQLDI